MADPCTDGNKRKATLEKDVQEIKTLEARLNFQTGGGRERNLTESPSSELRAISYGTLCIKGNDDNDLQPFCDRVDIRPRSPAGALLLCSPEPERSRQGPLVGRVQG
ncbi:hypothetical protein J6590_012588 [Homalodisca vitripennis]|nr:hypothetical protein J6590_012588 [Homalodisca vitripennis]